jgi:starch synthase
MTSTFGSDMNGMYPQSSEAKSMNVLFVTSECYPLVKTGGLADVTGALPLALAPLAIDARVLLPAYPGVRDKVASATAVAHIDDLFGGSATLLDATTEAGLRLLLIDAPHLYDRVGGSPYGAPNGRDWPDNHLRFAALSWVAAEIATGRLGRWQPEVVHLHDWHAALTAAYLHFDASFNDLSFKDAGTTRPRTLLTIHNLAFQGLFAERLLADLRLPAAALVPGGMAFWGNLSFLMAGVRWCDAVSTVSPTYAREIVTPENGMGFDSALAQRNDALIGIVNGIDSQVWNPATDPHIAATYTASNPEAKMANKFALQRELSLQPDSNATLFCVVSRLTQQKGLDLLLDALPRLLARGAQLAVLGSGDRTLEKGFRRAAKKHRGKVATIIGYDEALSHRMQAGADAIVVPSRFEPCGLTQLYGLRYGTLPVVANVGGLADTVIDGIDGFQFNPVDAEQLADALERACDAFATPTTWLPMMRQAMTTEVGWDAAARAYRALYDQLLRSRV